MRPQLRAGLRRYRVLIGVGGACAASLVLLAFLLYPASAPPVKVEGFSWQLIEGTTSGGTPWFKFLTINETGVANGFPFSIASGGSFSLTIVLINADSVDHEVFSLSLNSPFHVTGTSPVLPASAEAEEDNALTVYVTVTAPAGAQVFGQGVINTEA